MVILARRAGLQGGSKGGVGIAGALGAWIPGLMFDKTQSYQGAFILCIAVMSLSIAMIWMASPRKFHPMSPTAGMTEQ